MIIIEINHIRITLSDEEVMAMKNDMKLHNSSIYIRNKNDAKKLSTKTLQVLEEGRKERFSEAIRDNDMLYLTNMLYNLSILDICKLLLQKSKGYLNNT